MVSLALLVELEVVEVVVAWHLQAVPEPGHGAPDGRGELGDVLGLVPNLPQGG